MREAFALMRNIVSKFNGEAQTFKKIELPYAFFQIYTE